MSYMTPIVHFLQQTYVENSKNGFLKVSPFGKVFDVGNATRTAIITGQSQDNEYSNGNGSLMRILPLAFIDCSENDVRRVSAITHGHWISTEACVIFVRIFKECLTGRGIGKGKWIEELQKKTGSSVGLFCQTQISLFTFDFSG